MVKKKVKIKIIQKVEGIALRNFCIAIISKQTLFQKIEFPQGIRETLRRTDVGNYHRLESFD